MELKFMRSLTARERGLLGAIVSLRIPDLTAVPCALGGIEVRSHGEPVAVWVSSGLAFDMMPPGGNLVVEKQRGYMQALEATISLVRQRAKLIKAA